MDNPISPQPHGLLTTLQKTFLQVFAELPDNEQFYLTGGTALAEFYLGHRLSFDLDFPDEPERWPVKMLVDWSPGEIKTVFQNWSIRLMESLGK